MPQLNESLARLQKHLEEKGRKKEKFDLKDVMLRVLLDSITVGMFGIDFRAIEEGSEGERLLLEIGIILEEFFFKRIYNPFRKYMIFNREYQRAQQSVKYLDNLVLRICDNYRATHTAEEIEKDTSILGHLIRR